MVDITIEINECDKASVMNLLHGMGLKPNSKRKINVFQDKKVVLQYVELTKEDVEIIEHKLMKCNRENKLIITKP